MASGTMRELLTGAALDLLGASPDGRFLAFTEADAATKTSALKLLALSGGQTREVLRLKPTESINSLTFAWTPDSGSLVFKKQGGGTSEMWFAPLDGREAHKIDMPVAPSVVWRFNSRTNQVAFGIGQGARFEVWKMENFLPNHDAQK